MSVSKDKTGVLINMDKQLKEEITLLAKQDNRSFTNYVVKVLEEHISNLHKDKQAIIPNTHFQW